MFRFLFGNKRSASPARVSFRLQLEILEGRTLPSGFARPAPDSADLHKQRCPNAQNPRLWNPPDSTSYRISLENGMQASPGG